MDDTIVVRRARPKDAARLLEIGDRVNGETDFLARAPGEPGMTLREEKRFIGAMISEETSAFFVALYDGVIVGSLSFSGSRLLKFRHSGEFGMSVLHEYWGKGVGSRLLQTMIRWCRDVGIRKINLQVVEGNDRAIGLYKKFGFQPEGCMRDGIKIGGKYHNLLYMGLVLPDVG